MQRALNTVVGALLFVGLGFCYSQAVEPDISHARLGEWVVTPGIPAAFANPTHVNGRACRERAECGREGDCWKKEGDCEGIGECREVSSVGIGASMHVSPYCGCDGQTYTMARSMLFVNKAHEGPCEEKGPPAWLVAYFSAFFGGERGG